MPNRSFERDHRPQDLGQVARRNRHLGQHPQHGVQPARILSPAGLSKVVPRHHPQPRRQGLEQDRHQVRHQQNPDQRVAEPGAALKVGRPVPRVHVADADQVGRPQKREEPPQPTPRPGIRWDRDRPVHFLERAPIRTDPTRQVHRHPHLTGPESPEPTGSHTGLPGHHRHARDDRCDTRSADSLSNPFISLISDLSKTFSELLKKLFWGSKISHDVFDFVLFPAADESAV